MRKEGRGKERGRREGGVRDGGREGKGGLSPKSS